MKALKLLFVLLLFISCKQEKNQFEISKKCVQAIMKTDSSLGSIRNHDSEKISLSKTIDKYTNALEALNFTSCSKNFSDAFHTHISAWKDMKEVTNKHPKLRGEMHALFDSIKKTNDSLVFSKKLELIFSTWKEIEIAIEPYNLNK